MSPIFLLAATGIFLCVIAITPTRREQICLLVRAYINGWLYGEWRWW